MERTEKFDIKCEILYFIIHPVSTNIVRISFMIYHIKNKSKAKEDTIVLR